MAAVSEILTMEGIDYRFSDNKQTAIQVVKGRVGDSRDSEKKGQRGREEGGGGGIARW